MWKYDEDRGGIFGSKLGKFKILTPIQNLNINQGGGHQAFAQNSSHAHAVDLLDCISEFFKTDTLDEQNKYHCQSCGCLTRAHTRFRMKERKLLSEINAWYSSKGAHRAPEEVHLAGDQVENASQLSRGVLLRFRLSVGGGSNQREKSWLSPLCCDRASRVLGVERALLLLHSSWDVQRRHARGVQGWW